MLWGYKVRNSCVKPHMILPHVAPCKGRFTQLFSDHSFSAQMSMPITHFEVRLGLMSVAPCWHHGSPILTWSSSTQMSQPISHLRALSATLTSPSAVLHPWHSRILYLAPPTGPLQQWPLPSLDLLNQSTLDTHDPPSAPRWQISGADWDAYRHSLLLPQHFLSPDSACASVTSSIHTAASLAVPLTTPTFRHPSAYWWTSECSDARRKKAWAGCNFSFQCNKLKKKFLFKQERDSYL